MTYHYAISQLSGAGTSAECSIGDTTGKKERQNGKAAIISFFPDMTKEVVEKKNPPGDE